VSPIYWTSTSACKPLKHRVLCKKCSVHRHLQVTAAIEFVLLLHTSNPLVNWLAESAHRAFVGPDTAERSRAIRSARSHLVDEWREVPVM
jgi:cation transport regulator ChaC